MTERHAFVPLGDEEFRVGFLLTHPDPGVIEPSVLTVTSIARGEEPADDLSPLQQSAVAEWLADNLGAVVAA
jgi:hypothetical protein